ncbi:hypothetical protein I552_4047 [Mycobacterium xenopi 3993]|nr:hypothetical protein I552_4047 [Mycobacterium xenopi 3993]
MMCAGMVAMAWPVGMELPTLGPMAFFLAAAVWFVLVAAHVFSGDDGRLTNGYHANMMAAVAWLYAVMRGGPLGRRDHPPDHTMPSSPGMKMPGMDISVPTQPNPGGSLPSTGSRRSDSQVPQCIGCITISPSGKRTLRSTPRSSGTGERYARHSWPPAWPSCSA